MKIVAKIEDLCKVYGDGESSVQALRKVDLDVFEGEFIGIVGASGSGKSTLLNIMGGLDVPTSGKVSINGTELFERNMEEITEFRRKYIGFVFQDYNLIPVLTVYENIVFPIQLGGDDEDRKFVDEVIRLLGLEEKVNCFPGQLSGGQRQRVAIARALVTKPAIILADEPTGNLDSETSYQVMELLKSSAEQFKQTIVMITHNNSLTEYCDRVFCMSDGMLKGSSEKE